MNHITDTEHDGRSVTVDSAEGWHLTQPAIAHGVEGRALQLPATQA